MEAQEKVKPTLKNVLLAQMRSTHTNEDWFVPVNLAVKDLTPEQAQWTDGKGNHSIGQLVSHLAFWNRNQLAKFKGEKPEEFSGNNDESFTSYTKESWAALTAKLDKVMTDWEKAIEAADDKKLEEWYGTIANLSTHNAYHTGQIITVRKAQGSWKKQ